ncbi:hypothetical protein NSP_44250 [Nodularia spumigena CCY9414]|nr:hypothetical protein NSP_44250 [Nodularia spumigena CCY9414]
MLGAGGKKLTLNSALSTFQSASNITSLLALITAKLTLRFQFY